MIRTVGGVRTRWLMAIGMAVAVIGSGTAVDAAPRPFGDAKIIAQVPTPPGFPEGIATNGQLVWVSGPATFGTAGGPPSKVRLYQSPDRQAAQDVRRGR